jgi:hypothetical protein
MYTRMTSVLIRPYVARFSSALQLLRERGVLQGKHSIAIQTLLCFLSTFALIITMASLDGYRLDVDVLFSSFAVAALFAFALTEGRRPARPTRYAQLGFALTESRRPVRPARSARLAPFPVWSPVLNRRNFNP